MGVVKTIRKPARSTTRLFDLLEGHRTGVYRPQRFIVTVPVEEGTLLYSVLTGGLVFLSGDAYQDFAKTAAKDSPLRQLMAEMLFLVPEAFDEAAFVDDLRTFAEGRASMAKYYDTYYLYPTTACNARCFYCFEEDIEKMSMSPETAEKAADYIILKSCGRPVHITWFGGEPSLNLAVADLICHRLAKAGVTFRSKMISNGLLLTPEVVKRIVPQYHLGVVQISMDGTGQMYDRIKSFAGLSGDVSAYRTVCENIRALLDENVQIWIRFNIGNHNADNLLPMLEELCGQFGGYPSFSIFPQVLNEGGHELYTPAVRDHLFQVQKEAYRCVLSHGVSISKNRYSLPRLKLRSCLADSPNAVGISPEGRLYKCPENIAFTPSFGDVFAPEKVHEAQIHCFSEKRDWPRCRSCVFYPSCLNLSLCCARQKECLPCHFDFRLWKTQACMKDAWHQAQAEAAQA